MNRPFAQQPLVLEELAPRGGAPWWRLERVLIFGSDLVRGGLVVVPRGFETDLASVPRALWSIFPPYGQWARAAVVHDFLYRESGVSRFLADAIFREAMFQLGVPLWRRLAMYYAVRCWGWRCRSAGEPVHESSLWR